MQLSSRIQDYSEKGRTTFVYNYCHLSLHIYISKGLLKNPENSYKRTEEVKTDSCVVMVSVGFLL